MLWSPEESLPIAEIEKAGRSQNSPWMFWHSAPPSDVAKRNVMHFRVLQPPYDWGGRLEVFLSFSGLSRMEAPVGATIRPLKARLNAGTLANWESVKQLGSRSRILPRPLQVSAAFSDWTTSVGFVALTHRVHTPSLDSQYPAPVGRWFAPLFCGVSSIPSGADWIYSSSPKSTGHKPSSSCSDLRRRGRSKRPSAKEGAARPS